MAREEELNKASIEYRKSREECGAKDPILLDEVDEAHFMGAIWADKHPIQDEHWRDVRERAAIAAMQGLLTVPSRTGNPTDYAKVAICFADALIEEFKKK